MSERKVLNKYYPPDFDPSNIPRMKTQKNRPFNIRIMAPMNMRCNTCGEYIYKGKKFNSRKEDVEDEYYLGLRIFRFYIKCPRCVSEIAFKTDLENTDYTLEAGATRLFEAEKLARQMAEQEIKAKEDEELNNPMKVLENRTKASRNEIEQIDALEELKEMNSRHAKLDHAEMLQMHAEYEKHLARLQDEEDEKEIRAIFGATEDGKTIKRLREDDSDMLDEDKPSATKKLAVSQKATDILTQEASDRTSIATAKASIQPQAWEKSIGGLGNRNSLKNLVRKKKSTDKSTVLVQPSQTGSVNLVKESNDSVDSEKLQDTCSEISSEQVTSLRQTYDNTGEKNTTQNQPGSVEGKPVMNGSMSDTPCGVKSSSLGLLGDYSDSESNESDC